MAAKPPSMQPTEMTRPMTKFNALSCPKPASLVRCRACAGLAGAGGRGGSGARQPRASADALRIGSRWRFHVDPVWKISHAIGSLCRSFRAGRAAESGWTRSPQHRQHEHRRLSRRGGQLLDACSSQAGARRWLSPSSGDNYISLRPAKSPAPATRSTSRCTARLVRDRDAVRRRLTRDGRLHMDETGSLLSVNNYPHSRRRRLRHPARSQSAGRRSFASDGMISQNGRQVGAIGLFQVDPDAG